MRRPCRILVLVLAVGLLASAQVGRLNDDGRKALVRTSSLIVVAVPEAEVSWIVNCVKMKAARANLLLPNPSEFVVGRLVNARVLDVLKADRSVKKDEVLRVFAKGWQDDLDAGNVITVGEKTILFLSRMSESDARLKDTGLYLPEAKAPRVLPFDPSNLYTPSRGDMESLQQGS
jgi:hypothetical protein